MASTYYQIFLAQAEALKCETCKGSGMLNDAELGDISFRSWPCEQCKATGFKGALKAQIVIP